MRKAGDIIAEMLENQFGPEFAEDARSSARLFSSWNLVVTEVWSPEEKPAVAVHSRIKELEKGVLLVEADHPGWVQILQTRQAELLSAIQLKNPQKDIRAISFMLSRKKNVPL